jgi:hypothetical protein
MSFDPFHCIEMRWGAEGDERQSCPEGHDKGKWYEAEQRLRNQPDRTYDVTMNFSLDDLQHHHAGSGIDSGPPIDIKSLIDGMGDQVSFQGMTPVGK